MSTQTLPAIQQYRSAGGVTLYRLPMEVFPGFIGYAYLVLGLSVPTLIDTGSGYLSSSDHLEQGIATLRDHYGEALSITDIGRIIITHGHVDHFGGLADMLRATGGAQVGIHPLDKRVLTHYEERVVVATKNLTIYLKRAGIEGQRLHDLLDMYGFSKQHVRSVKVDFTFEDGENIDGMQFWHVPGHCSGQVAIRFDDILLSADHILSHTSPHVAAESITHYTGLGHYLESLRKVRQFEGIRLTLGGHEDPIDDLHGRIDYLQMRIDQKLERLLDILRDAETPLSVLQISKAMYPDKHGFNVLLALQEAGAYVEYLYERGHLSVANLRDVESSDNPTLLYSAL